METKLGVESCWLSVQEIVIERACLNDALTSLHRDVQLERLVQHITVQGPGLNVRFHCMNWLLHGKATNESSTVSLAMIETAMMSAGLGWGVGREWHIFLMHTLSLSSHQGREEHHRLSCEHGCKLPCWLHHSHSGGWAEHLPKQHHFSFMINLILSTLRF